MGASNHIANVSESFKSSLLRLESLHLFRRPLNDENVKSVGVAYEGAGEVTGKVVPLTWNLATRFARPRRPGSCQSGSWGGEYKLVVRTVA